MPDLLLGVDGGSHRTQAVIADRDGRVLGRGLGPACNHHRVGIDAARDALSTAIEGALTQVANEGATNPDGTSSWVKSGRIAAASFGLSGVDGPQDEALFSSWLRSLGCDFPFVVGNDSDLVLGGGTPDGWGVALISDTGSICVGRSREGTTQRVGGWGHVLGDEGSGYHVATEALKLAMHSADSRGGSAGLLKAALAHWDVSRPQDLIRVAYGSETRADDIAGFATRVLDLATRSDPDALGVVDRAATALALQVDTVIRELRLDLPPLALGGTMMRVTFRKAILERIKSPLGPVEVVVDAARGAVMIARRLMLSSRAA
jgi:N-acetylglucosamine kinase-like BadF-type ATPase